MNLYSTQHLDENNKILLIIRYRRENNNMNWLLQLDYLWRSIFIIHQMQFSSVKGILYHPLCYYKKMSRWMSVSFMCKQNIEKELEFRFYLLLGKVHTHRSHTKSFVIIWMDAIQYCDSMCKFIVTQLHFHFSFVSTFTQTLL